MNKEEIYHEALDKLEELRYRIINNEIEVDSVGEEGSNYGKGGLHITYHELKEEYQ